jgi:protein SCO1
MLNRRRVATAVALAPCALLQAPRQGTAGPGRADFPNVALLDQDGRTVRFFDDLIRGDHTVVINFIYAQCGDICPMTMANLARVQDLLGERLGRQVRLASISIDPIRDSPIVLKAYASQFDARTGWQFLTGWPQDIERIRITLGAYDRDPDIDKDRSQHAGVLVYGNQVRGRWGRVSGLADPRRIIASITRWA